MIPTVPLHTQRKNGWWGFFKEPVGLSENQKGFQGLFWLMMDYFRTKCIKKNGLILKVEGLSELKMVYQKTKIDSLVGSEGFWVIMMCFTVYMHILQCTLPDAMKE